MCMLEMMLRVPAKLLQGYKARSCLAGLKSRPILPQDSFCYPGNSLRESCPVEKLLGQQTPFQFSYQQAKSPSGQPIFWLSTCIFGVISFLLCGIVIKQCLSGSGGLQVRATCLVIREEFVSNASEADGCVRLVTSLADWLPLIQGSFSLCTPL